MSGDLVGRLRAHADRMGSPDRITLAHDAADEIERLRAELDKAQHRAYDLEAECRRLEMEVARGW